MTNIPRGNDAAWALQFREGSKVMAQELEMVIHEWSKQAVEEAFLSDDPLAAIKALVEAKTQEIMTSGETYTVSKESWDWAQAEADKILAAE
jgi:hypothetical protein